MKFRIPDVAQKFLFANRQVSASTVTAGKKVFPVGAIFREFEIDDVLWRKICANIIFPQAAGISGIATLVNGTVTVSNTGVQNAGMAIFLNRRTAGGTLGHLSYTITDNTSFTITSSSLLETSTIDWLVIQRA